MIWISSPVQSLLLQSLYSSWQLPQSAASTQAPEEPKPAGVDTQQVWKFKYLQLINIYNGNYLCYNNLIKPNKHSYTISKIANNLQKTHQEIFPSESSTHQLTDPLVFVELFTGRGGNVIISSLKVALTDEQKALLEQQWYPFWW